MRYNEIPLFAPVSEASRLQPAGYLAANPDVVVAGMDPLAHFVEYGQKEGRRQHQLSEIAEQRREKLRRVSFRKEPLSVRDSGTLCYISDDDKKAFNFPDHIPVAENEYNPEIIAWIRDNPDALFLDIGSGLRHTCYSNVVTTEIWPSASTDVVSLGEHLPFADQQFDFIICLAVLEHTVKPEIVCDEIVRILKPGGIARIDWPFLQPVHGYPHHYFNATPQGAISRFEKTCEILSSDVKQWQHPVFTLQAILQEWQSGLPEATSNDFRNLTIGHFIDGSVHDLVREETSARLSQDVQRIIAAGTTIDVRKR